MGCDERPDDPTFREAAEAIIRVGEAEQIRRQQAKKVDPVTRPKHYGGAENPYEAVKCIEAWDLGFNLGNVVKYLCRAGKKPGASMLTDLRKAKWYLEREIELAEKR